MVQQDPSFRLFGRIWRATFISRPNRFLIYCNLNGRTVPAFLPNPGRLQELLISGRRVYLIREDGFRRRKTHFTAVAVLRNGVPIMLHTHRTNAMVKYLLQRDRIPGLEGARIIRSEVLMGRNRFDFLLRKGKKEILLEVKSCTLVGQRVAMFPDAITERGTRHLRTLAAFSEHGKKGAVLFIVHWPFAEFFMPDYHTDLNFSKAFLDVRHKIKIIPLSIRWQEDLSLLPETRRLQIPWGYIEKEARDQGSYLLILELRRGRKISIGKLGDPFFKKGFYVYVGSAMAHLTKRIERHRHLRKRHHWHIDQLRAQTDFISALVIRSSTRLECEIAERLSKICEWTIPGFGSSDCACPTHLFAMSENPIHSENFQNLLQYFRMDRFGQ